MSLLLCIRAFSLTLLIMGSLWHNSWLMHCAESLSSHRTLMQSGVQPETDGIVQPIERYSFVGTDFPMQLPLGEHTPLVKLVAEESVHYPMAGRRAHLEWLWTATEGNNDIHLGSENRAFTFAMVHELHCLRMIRKAIGDSSPETLYPDRNMHHLQHCFNYLRKWILCSADVTLEPGDFKLRDFERERLGGTYTCRDWEHVYGVAQRNWNQWKEFRHQYWDEQTGWKLGNGTVMPIPH